MEEPTTKPSGSNPASPSSTYSETDRSEVKTPDGLAPAVWASLLSAACGSHPEVSAACRFEKRGIELSLRRARRHAALAPRSLPARSLGRRPAGQGPDLRQLACFFGALGGITRHPGDHHGQQDGRDEKRQQQQPEPVPQRVALVAGPVPPQDVAADDRDDPADSHQAEDQLVVSAQRTPGR